MRLIDILRNKIYKKELLKHVGNKPKNTIVLGKCFYENNKILLGDNVIIYPGVMFSGNSIIRIGDNVKIGKDTIIYANKNGGVTIGANTIIAGQCYIIDSNHGIEKDSLIQKQKLSAAEVCIGTDVWVGAHCTIIKGAKIDDGAVIGANSLVNSVIPSYGIAFGTPAVLRKYRE